MKLIIAAIFILFSTIVSFASVKVGQPAKDFNRVDHMGKTHTLSAHKGKWIVLEWFNEDCPYVKKHYVSNNMQSLQSTYTAKGVVWLTVASSAKGEQGHVPADKAKEQYNRSNMKSTALLLDEDGVLGKAYGAVSTPHMYIINPEGKLIYVGAIDDNSSADPQKIKTSKNHVVAALDAAMAGKKVPVEVTKPYGCSVKYN